MKKMRFFLPMAAFVLAGGIAFAQTYSELPNGQGQQFDCEGPNEPTCIQAVGQTAWSLETNEEVDLPDETYIPR